MVEEIPGAGMADTSADPGQSLGQELALQEELVVVP